MNLDKISKWLRKNYSFNSPPKVSLLRAYTNDVYLIELSGEKFVLKIYGKNWRSQDEINYEIELLEYLSSKGLLVAKAIPSRNNQPVEQIKTLLGNQWAVLYEYAYGEKPQRPFSNELYFLFGEAIGKMHLISSSFVSSYQRKNLDLAYLIDEPIKIVKPLLSENPDNLILLTEIADNIKKKITELCEKGLNWGPIHGDATLDNLHITKNKEIVLYDFDSGGPGWRASDLQGWAVNNMERQGDYDSFIKGYQCMKELNQRDIEASPYLTIAWEIWGLKIDLENRIFKQGQEKVKVYLDKQIQVIKDKNDQLPR